MCTRFYAAQSPELRPYIEAAKKNRIAEQMMRHLARPMTMTGEIRPTDMAAVIAPNKHGERSIFPMLWGFYEENLHKPIVNCRIESARIKPLWSDSWKQRRCVIPASYVSPQSPGVIKTLNSHGNKHHGSHSDLLFIPIQTNSDIFAITR